MSARLARVGHRRRVLATVLTAAALGLAACGGGGIKPADVEADIASRLGNQVDAQVEQVHCPDPIPSKPGDTFTCTAFIRGGTPLEVPVTVSAGANFDWQVVARSHSGAEVVAKVQPEMRDQLNDPGLQLTCPETAVVADGDTIDCTAVDSQGLQEPVTVQARGDGYQWEVLAD